MRMNQWTQGLLAAGLISLPAVAQAEEKQPSMVLTAVSSTTLSGYVDTAAIWKFGTGNANMPGRVYDGPDVQDGFNLSVVSLTLDKPLDEGQWSAGYHIQMLMGPGAAKRGTGLMASFSTTEFSFNEAYVALRVPVGNGIDFKVGQFGTYNGFEAYDTYKNPNWSRSYGFFNETSAHTGVSAFYKINDAVSVQAGVGNVGPFNSQVDARSSVESSKAYLGMITLTAPESMGFMKGASLSAGYTTGPANGSNEPHIDQYYLGGTLPTPIEGLTLGLAFDFTDDLTIGTVNGESWCLAAYVGWQATEKLKLNTRVDYTAATQGWYYPAVAGTGTSHGGNDQLGSLTITADYSLWANVISRLEFRWDRSLDGTEPYGGTVAGTPRDRDAVSLNANVIYMF